MIFIKDRLLVRFSFRNCKLGFFFMLILLEWLVWCKEGERKKKKGKKKRLDIVIL